MKRLSLIVVLMIVCGWLTTGYAQVSLTFQVDMAFQSVNPAGVSVAGDFQMAAGYPSNWTPGSTVLSQVGATSVYAITVSVPSGTYYFKYINGNVWGQDESVPGGCAFGGNRQVIVGTDPVVLEAICFGSCTVCNPPTVDVTFKVNMAEQTVSGNGVHIAGSFQGWDPGATLMTLESDMVYTYTATLAAGGYYEYKFINGNAWGTDESVPGGCNQNGNRYINVPSVNTVLDPVCFGSCVNCAAPTINVTFQVDMSTQTVSPEGVHIAGSFQGWDPGSTLMTDAGSGVYTYTAALAIGESIEYKFINGNAWGSDESVPAECSNGWNRYLTVPATDLTLDVVCFASCEACPVPTPPSYIIDFEGDGEVKPGYATGTVNLNGLNWDMTNVLIGVESNDWKNGLRSARLRGYGTSSMTMLENKTNGIGTISFQYRRYGSDTQVDWKVEYSIDNGGLWTQIGSAFTAQASDVVQTFSEAVNIDGDVRVRIKRATESGTSNRRLNIDDIEITNFTGGAAVVATPYFSHTSQNYFNPVDLSIFCDTPGSTIYYTLDGSDPDNNSSEYSTPIPISSTTTVKAIAYATGFDPSNIAEVTLTFPPVIQVANLSDLRTALYGKADYYQITGEVFLTFQQAWRNQKFVQDATAGVMIDDNAGIITTSFNLGDGITGLIGTITDYNGMMEFIPVVDPGPATSSGNVIVPQVITLNEMVTNFENYESELVKIEGVTFANGGSNWANGTVYAMTDGSKGTGNFRTTFYDVDYIGQPIPVTTANVTGLCNTYLNQDYLTARFLDDFEVPPTIIVTSPNGGEQIEQGTQFEINWFVANFTGDVEVVLHTPIIKGGVVLGIVPAADGSFTWDVTQDVGEYIVIVKAVGADEPVDWSDETFNIVYPFDIKITEIMYNPSGDDVYEFLEIYNNGLGTVNLLGWHFTKGIVMTFPDVVIAPGEHLVTVYDADAFFNQFGINALEWTSGNLNNSGEAVELSDNLGNVRSYVNYDDGGLWPAVCDGEGPSLTFCDPSLGNNDPANWSASVEFAGNTATVDPLYCTPGTGCGQGNYLANWYPEGWLGVSSNLVPAKITMEELWTPAYNNLVIMLGETGVFWPSQNINTIGNWNYEMGYKAKFDGNTYFVFSGELPVDRTVDVPTGNHLIPVLSEGPALVEDVIVPLGNAIEFMFDIHDGLIYWPAGGILPGSSGSSLNTLEPGYAYIAKINTPVTIDFTAKSQSVNQNPAVQFTNNTTWNNVARTGEQHLISLNGSALEVLEAGDVIGIFNSAGICAGMSAFTGTEPVLPLIVYGNDMTTSEIDGMNNQEMMNVRIYRNGEILEAVAVYNPEFENNDGTFTSNGLSMISYLKMGATAIGENTVVPAIYPNPGNGLFNISIEGEYEVTITNAQGQLILSTKINGQGVIDLTGQSGIYFVQFTNETFTSTERIVVK